MSMLPTTTNGRRFTVLGAVVALAAGGVVASNLAGAASGTSAVDYAQCANGAPGSTAACTWINGVLNANNSQYQEDQVVPQRLLVSFTDPKNGTHAHTVTLRYLDRKSTGHAYDYLASADFTQADAVSTRCDGVSFAGCSSLSPNGSADMTSDLATTELPPAASGVSTKIVDHMGLFPQANRQLYIWGGTFATPAMSVPSHDCLAPCTGDDYASTTLSFTTPANTGNGPEVHYVQILFGGHLAAGQVTVSQTDGWGVGFGAASINGGPYHIKWDAADGASVGNRDNQIMSSAIIPIVAQGTTMGSTATPTGDVAIGASSLTTAHDVANLLVADATHPPNGTASFTLYGPFSSAPGLTDCVAAKAVSGSTKTSTSWSQDGTVTKLYHATGGNFDVNGISGLAAGQYYEWVASYDPGSTDFYNEASSSACNDTGEQIHITKAAAAATSTQTVIDNVTVTGNVAGGTPDGHVSWYLYPTLADCNADTNATASDIYQSPVSPDTDTNNALDSNGKASSKGVTLTATSSTTYYWKVVYEGGTNYSSSTVETCGTQTVTIDN